MIPDFMTIQQPAQTLDRHTQTQHSVLDSLIYSLRKYAIKYVNYVPNIRLQNPMLFSWRYNPLWLYFHNPVAGFSLLVFEVS